MQIMFFNRLNQYVNIIENHRLIRIIRVKITWMHKNSILVTKDSIKIFYGIILIIPLLFNYKHDYLFRVENINFSYLGKVFNIQFNVALYSFFCLYIGIVLIISSFRRNVYIKQFYNIIFFPSRCLVTLLIYFIRYVYIPYINIIVLLILVVFFNLYIPIKNNSLLLYTVISAISISAIGPTDKCSKKLRNFFYYIFKNVDSGFRKKIHFKEEKFRIKNKRFTPYKFSDQLNNIVNILYINENEDFTNQSRKVIYFTYYLLIVYSCFIKFYTKDIINYKEFAELTALYNSFLPSFDVTCSAFVTFIAYDRALQMKAFPTKAYFDKVFQRIKTIFKIID